MPTLASASTVRTTSTDGVDPILKRYIQNALIQVSQEQRAARFKSRGQGSRQRAQKRAQKTAA